jgi:4-amino-4-deoxychorismate lyase
MKIIMNQLNIYDDTLNLIDHPVAFKNRAFLYGESLFTTIRISGSKPLFLEEHLSRLKRSVNFLYGEEIHENVQSHILKLSKKCLQGKIRVTFYKESDYEGITDHHGVLKVIYYVKSLNDHFLDNIQEVSLSLSESKQIESILPSFLKNGNYLLQSLEKSKAINKGFNDVLFHNIDGFITESSTSNILLRKGKDFFTPKTSSMVLDGITRNVIVDGLCKNKINIYQKNILVKEILEMDECWLLNSISGLQKIIKFEEHNYVSSNEWTETIKKILLEG